MRCVRAPNPRIVRGRRLQQELHGRAEVKSGGQLSSGLLLLRRLHGRRLKQEKELIKPSEALRCMRTVAEGLGHSARLFVAVDAPALQRLAFEELGAKAFITPGVGIDPTNEYRDGVQAGAERKAQYGGQVLARQELAERNLIKVSLDYFIQGFCLSAMTLRPSAFYAAATLRTGVLKEHIWRNITKALLATTSDSLSNASRCLRSEGQARRKITNIHLCQRRLCRLTACDNG